MALATWWRDDALPTLPPLDDFHVKSIQDNALLAQLCRLDNQDLRRRFQNGHRPYVGFLQGVPVAYGWVATRRASIGELGLCFELPPLHRYLWDFATLPAYRGRGIYPHLLQEILIRELGPAYFFWIIYAPENGASGAGIRKAGFTQVGRLSLTDEGCAALVPVIGSRRAQFAAALLGVPLMDSGVYPCWHCGGADYPAAGAACHVCHPLQAGQSDNCVCTTKSGRQAAHASLARRPVSA